MFNGIPINVQKDKEVVAEPEQVDKNETEGEEGVEEGVTD